VNIQVPYAYHPRTYQLKFFEAMQKGAKRAVLVWHRRSGKDKTAVNFVLTRMLDRVGSYYYFFPTYTQGQKVLWDGIDKSGFKFMDHFPKPLVKGKPNEVEMSLELVNGSRFQIIGVDNIDRVMGTNPVGVVFSEYSLMNPKAWDLIRPILAENGGWAVFIYTPRGKNWGYDLYNAALKNPAWYTSMLTVADTLRDGPGEDGLPVVGPDIIQDERLSGMSEELIQQEYFCSFEGALEGNYYGDLITKAYTEGRFKESHFLEEWPVDTAWDIGVDDATAIVFTQTAGQIPYIVDFIEGGKMGLSLKGGLATYAKALQMKPYLYGQHYWPHDAKVTEWGSGKTRLQLAHAMGFKDSGFGGLGSVTVVPKQSLADGIEATRMFLARARWRDIPAVHRLADYLKSYHREWDPEQKVWSPKPVHDESSHASDAMRYRALSWFAQQDGVLPATSLTGWNPWQDTQKAEKSQTDFDIFKF
jgi:phage terminase large subunit